MSTRPGFEHDDPEPAGPAILAEGVQMHFPRGPEPVRALRGVDLEVPRGQFVCVLGPSGCGKTTLLNVIAGLLVPTAGRVQVAGTEVSALSQDQAAVFRRRHIGIVFQFFNLVPMLNLEENVALPLLLDGLPLQALRSRLTPLLEELGISGRRHHSIDELSGGELQRAAVARALLAEPTLVLADEPTGNLDSATGEQVLRMLHAVGREHGVTIFLFTHDARAISFADRVLSLRDGRIVSDLPRALPPDGP